MSFAVCHLSTSSRVRHVSTPESGTLSLKYPRKVSTLACWRAEGKVVYTGGVLLGGAA